MIQRLVTTLRALAAIDPDQLPLREGRRLAADCADALRLELDCPQQDLTAEQRRALGELDGLLESADTADPRAVVAAARAACEAVGLAC
jgi:hypothetical protein